MTSQKHKNCDPNIRYITKENGKEIISCECQERQKCWDEAAKKHPNLNPFAALVKEANKSPQKMLKESMAELEKLIQKKKE